MALKNHLDEFVSFAYFLADESAKITLKFFRQNFTTENKEDNSPVTIADKNAHLAIEDSLESTNIPILSEEGKNIEYEKRGN